MRWPWQRRHSVNQWVLSWSAQTLSYVHARRLSDGTFELLAIGNEHQGGEDFDSFVKRLHGLGLRGAQAIFMLRTEQYQLLQIDTPAVPPEELRAAARYQVRDMLQAHVDDVTIDVIRVGDAQNKTNRHSFVVAANNSVIKEVMDLAGALDCRVSVIDIQDTAQRNLQTALTQRDGTLERANAALVLDDEHQALLTISANEELFYARRFELPKGFLTGIWGQAVDVQAPVDGFTPVEEYMPSHGSGDLVFGSDFEHIQLHSPEDPLPVAAAPAAKISPDDEQAQRLVVEIQRSLDVWDRTWSSMVLSGLRVFAGSRSPELAQWLTRQLGQPVIALDVTALFAGFEEVSPLDQGLCLPLLGVLLRGEGGSS